MRIDPMILSLNGKILVRENSCSGILYAVFMGRITIRGVTNAIKCLVIVRLYL